jgi:hypothetical protein
MKIISLVFLSLLSPPLLATEVLPKLDPLLGERGDVIFSESFDGPNAVPLRVIPNTKSEIAEGGVSLATKIERPEWGHGGIAFVYGKDRPGLGDFILEADFRWDAGQRFGFLFDKLVKTQAHGEPPEFFIRFSRPKDPTQPGSWDIRDNAPEAVVGEPRASSAPAPDAKGRVKREGITVARQEATFAPRQWYRVMIEVRNGEVAVQLSNGQSLRGRCNQASFPKFSPKIGVGEGDCLVDNIKISDFR